MRIDFEPGLYADDPDLSGTPFWLWGENIRFTGVLPETIGLFGNAKNSANANIVLASSDKPRLWVDDGLTLAAAGDRVALIDVAAGTVDSKTLAAIVSGRWWFDTTEDEIIAGKSGLNTVRVIPRDGSAPSVLANAPAPVGDGIRCGGIVADILVLAGGVTSFGTNPSDLLIRWSNRRADPPNTLGHVGFEAWTPEPTNSSGEIILGSGTKIVGGGASTFGFVVWTDMAMHMLTPRSDLYVFSEEIVTKRGLLAQDAWIESDKKIWFYDTTRTLNVYDGGAPRQIPNPIYDATIGQLDPTDVGNVSMSTLQRFGEVILNYRDRDGARRQLVYNHLMNTFYNWTLSRSALVDEQGVQPALGVGLDGSLFLHEIPVVLPREHLSPLGVTGSPPAPTQTRFDVEPVAFDFLLSSSRFSGDTMPYGALQAVEMVIPRVRTRSLKQPTPSGETLATSLIGVGKNEMASTVHIDTQSNPVDQEQSSHRVRGKSLRIVLKGTAMRTRLRFGMPDVIMTPVAKR
jgi:hypothetical protein